MDIRLEHLISEQARKTPEARAVISEKESISYQELEDQSTQIANTLLSNGLQPGSRVCILLPKSIKAIVSIVATLKAGCTYVPLDTMSPPFRLAQILKKVESSFIISGYELAPVIAQSLSVLEKSVLPSVCWLGDDMPECLQPFTVVTPRQKNENRRGEIQKLQNPASLAYIIFTSGSTGEPKGVTITHANVINLLNWIYYELPIDPEDRIALFPPLYFDGSVWHVFGALTSGAELHLVSARYNLVPRLMADFVRNSGITQWLSVPSLLVSISNNGLVAPGDFPKLRRIIWGGEAFPTAALQHWMARLPHVKFTNSYGPAEATVGCSFYTLKVMPNDAGEPVPIGSAISGTTLMVLDINGKAVEVNEIGDLYISGAGLSPGYWNDEELTAAAFKEIPAGSGNRWYRTGDLARVDDAGIFHFCGRADRQIKSRGYRIELDDIAAAITRIPDIAECTVVSIPSEGFETNSICAAYVLHPGATLNAVDIKTILAASLPFYMLPKFWLELSDLPKSKNGKTDQNKVEQLFLNTKNKLSDV